MVSGTRRQKVHSLCGQVGTVGALAWTLRSTGSLVRKGSRGGGREQGKAHMGTPASRGGDPDADQEGGGMGRKT